MLGIFLDTETNGLNPRKHCVLEIALQIVDVMDGRVLESFESVIKISSEEWSRSDPDSLQVNGFTWDETLKGSSAPAVSDKICALFARHKIKRGEAVFICQNPSFDRVFFSQLIDPDKQEKLQWPYHWLDLASMYWARALHKAAHGQGLFPWETGLSKDKIARAEHLPPEQQPHRAMNGVKHLLQCYTAVVGFPKTSH